MIGLVIFTAVLALFLWVLVDYARRRYRGTTRGVSGVGYSDRAWLRELVPALAYAGILELTATCAALLAIAVAVLVLRALF